MNRVEDKNLMSNEHRSKASESLKSWLSDEHKQEALKNLAKSPGVGRVTYTWDPEVYEVEFYSKGDGIFSLVRKEVTE